MLSLGSEPRVARAGPAAGEAVGPLAGGVSAPRSRGRFPRWALHIPRFIALAALVALIAALGRAEALRSARADSGSLDGALARWTHRAPSGVAVALDSAPPSGVQRDWLAALRRAGTPVSWSGNGIAPLAVSADRVREPDGALRLRITGAAGRRAEVRDRSGFVDSVGLANVATIVELPGASRGVTVRVAGTAAAAPDLAADPVRHVLLLGNAGWEAKFVLAALEERGWQVGARLAVAPGIDVRQEPLGPLDTASYGAVIALDSMTPAQGAELLRFAQSGGGVVLGPRAAGSQSLAGLRGGRPGRRVPGLAGAVRGERPRDGLPVVGIEGLASDAVVLERRGTTVALAARRVGRARVVQLGYDDSWRWRLEADSGLAPHRDWWSALVASVQPEPAPASPPPNEGSAPLAALVAALGPSTPLAAGDAPVQRDWLLPLLFATCLAGLLTDWSLRRLRGAR